MYGAFAAGRPMMCGLVPVRERSEIAFLAKEAEIVTGKPGRQFVVAGAARQVYQVAVASFVFEVTSLDEVNEPVVTDAVAIEELGQHLLGAALQSGRLFAQVVN